MKEICMTPKPMNANVYCIVYYYITISLYCCGCYMKILIIGLKLMTNTNYTRIFNMYKDSFLCK